MSIILTCEGKAHHTQLALSWQEAYQWALRKRLQGEDTKFEHGGRGECSFDEVGRDNFKAKKHNYRLFHAHLNFTANKALIMLNIISLFSFLCIINVLPLWINHVQFMMFKQTLKILHVKGYEKVTTRKYVCNFILLLHHVTIMKNYRFGAKLES